MRRALQILAALAVLLIPLMGLSPSQAQNWPNRPVKFVLTLGAGAGADISARLLADRLTKKWGQPVVVENRPGGDGIVAITAVLSAHDDHVLLYAPSSSFIGHPYLHDKMPYKASDITAIARVSNTVVAFSVPITHPANNFKELVDMAKAKPGDMNWAGLTGALDIMFEGWLKSINVDIKKVPYRNPVEALNDLAAGRVQIYESAYAIARPQIQAGKIKALAITNTARASAIPDIPTVAEAGFPALTIDGLVGLYGLPDMPMALREKIAADIKEIMDNDAIIKDRLVLTAQISNPGGPVEFAKSIEEQKGILARAAQDLGIKGATN